MNMQIRIKLILNIGLVLLLSKTFAQITPRPKVYVQFPTYSFNDQSRYTSSFLGCTPGMSYKFKKGGNVVFENAVEENVLPKEDVNYNNHPYRGFLVFPEGEDYTFEYTNTSKLSNFPNLLVFFKSNGDGHFYEKPGALASPQILAQGQIQKGGTFISPNLKLIDDASPNYPSYSLPNSDFIYYKRIFLNIRENGKISLKDFEIIDITDNNRKSTYNNYATGFGWWIAVNNWMSTSLRTSRLRFSVIDEPNKFITVDFVVERDGVVGNYTVINSESSGHLSINEEDVSIPKFAMVINISGKTSFDVPSSGIYNPNGTNGYNDNYQYGLGQFFKLGNDVYWRDSTATMTTVNPNLDYYTCTGPKVVQPLLNLSANSILNIPAIGGDQPPVNITANNEWVVSVSDPWISVTQTSGLNGSIIIKVITNNSNTKREGFVLVKTSKNEEKISVSQLGKQIQTLTFGSIANKLVNDVPFKLNASSTTNLPITFKIIAGEATINNDLLTLNGKAGAIEVQANQAGNDVYSAAVGVNQVFQVSKLTQTIDFQLKSPLLSNNGPIILNASSNSSLPITYKLLEGPAIIENGILKLNGNSGKVIVEASQIGNETYESSSLKAQFDVITVLPNEVIVKIDSKNTSARVSPNPANNQVNIIAGSEVKSFSVNNSAGLSFNLQFQKVKNFEYTSDFSKIPNGLYFIQLEYKGNAKETFKVLISH